MARKGGFQGVPGFYNASGRSVDSGFQQAHASASRGSALTVYTVAYHFSTNTMSDATGTACGPSQRIAGGR